MKKVVISILVLAAAFAGIFYVLNSNKAKNEAQVAVVAQKNAAVAVRADVADFREVNSAYLSNGTFIPKQEVMISAETPGKVERVLVAEGAYVKAGQVLAVIKGDKQNVGVNNALVVYNNAKAEVERFESAYASGGVTKQQLDQVKLQLATAKNNLESAKLTAGDVNITASFAGVVNKRNVEPGSYVNPGQQLFEVVNVSVLKLKVNVDEKNVSNIRIGQQVNVTSSVLPESNFTGVVTFIAPKADASLNFPVELEIKNNANGALKAGMYGTAKFGGDAMANVFTVPRTAFVGSVSTGEVFVEKEGKAILTKVVTGRNFGDFVEVLSGLEQGQKVITSGQINLVNESAIEIIN